ncbi:MAG: pseudouridine synthase [Armatimonadetes bacterium CG_4_10_14_3_um_filter_66_18]|nr:rRNA pseudouridine synthase [Armatimonadota bacterium]OIO95220.1 MAG: hypothetical protein AUJ96_27240 [Armatimonadetes bacterium CG2_30_66_41]PIU89679.1 MAG: pseudouridine synthase [Armatimonadetes bacterium CG06_land_8_20_14_3_00_66_21]PIX49582.1 MAG: pseudouridine synthase [Armatimonadetes bacterium CG_4_8_14_3_um_filter_66_20]PIY53146.1 MAG: pseudouridine synthase [Armatimonadetes bacterium CG_4_10_14_3_um_filter_66_18]PIZ50158.1 MAG: pseudouridine synthase [Armatimonadetes bacterium CG
MERLQKLIASAGVASRRGAEELVVAGRVTVNGEVVTKLGTQADPDTDSIEVDGEPLLRSVPLQYVALNKPVGYVTTRQDESARPTVMDLLPQDLRQLHPVGRLDMDTSGLLFLTNDGTLTHRLTHPSFGVRKTYIAVVRGKLGEEATRRLTEGVVLRDGPTSPAAVETLSLGETTSRVRITIVEGRKRIVRRMFACVGHPVVFLQRTEIGPVTLTGIGLGLHRELTGDEVSALLAVSRDKSA